MFRPLAWTKTLAVGFSSLLAITLVPMLMVIFIRGQLRPESAKSISRITQAIYLPVLRLCLRFRKTTLAAEFVFPARDLSLGVQAGQPVHAAAVMKAHRSTCPLRCPAFRSRRHAALAGTGPDSPQSFPEVETVFGAVGRSDSATDNAPLDMYDTTVMLKPREKWRPGMTYEKLIREMDEKLQFPGLTNTWTMPVQNRLDMALTGIKTPVGNEDPGPESGRNPAARVADPADSFGTAASALRFCGARFAGLLHQCRSQPRQRRPATV